VPISCRLCLNPVIILLIQTSNLGIHLAFNTERMKENVKEGIKMEVNA
jgi:hypothetical protein